MDELSNSGPGVVQTPTNSPMKAGKRRANSSAFSPGRRSPRVRGSPRRQLSRLPIRLHRPVVKELNLPPDESFSTSPPTQQASKVTPEKLMQELKEQVAKMKRLRKMVEVDDEISIPFTEMVLLNSPPTLKSSDESPLTRKSFLMEDVAAHLVTEPRPVRVSSRIHSQVTVESPDLPQEDPLEIALQTLQNTRLNSGYRTCQLVFSNEYIDKPRPGSPDHAFSQQVGLQRHILKLPQNSEDEKGCKLRFNHLLHFLDSQEEEDLIIDENALLNRVPSKPCIVQKQLSQEMVEKPNKRSVIQVKRLIYPGSLASTTLEASISKPRRLFGAAKRAPARNQ